MQTLKELLKEKRDRLGYSFAQMGISSGISRGHLNHLEKGTYEFTEDTLVKLAPVLGVPLEELLVRLNIERMGESGSRSFLRIAPRILDPAGD